MSIIFVLYQIKLVFILRTISVNIEAYLGPGQTSR